MSFQHAFEKVVGIEGRYSNDPKDSGGETMYGITAAVARANWYAGAMRDMPLQTAQDIYRRQYWDLLRLNDVDALSPSIAYEMFDTAINQGVGVAGRFLQRALNALNREGSDYQDMVVDGIVGPGTMHALRAYLVRRGPEGEVVLVRALNALQGAGYIELVERRPKDERFLFGWFFNRVEI